MNGNTGLSEKRRGAALTIIARNGNCIKADTVRCVECPLEDTEFCRRDHPGRVAACKHYIFLLDCRAADNMMRRAAGIEEVRDQEYR